MKENFTLVLYLISVFIISLSMIFLIESHKKRLIAGILSSVMILVVFHGFFMFSGTPRPAPYELLLGLEKMKVLQYKIENNDAIFLWVEVDNSKYPLYIKFPYDQRVAKALQEAEKKGKGKGKMVLVKKKSKNQKDEGRWYETSLKDFDIRYEIDFPQKTPEKMIEKEEIINLNRTTE